jgi:3D (Asp-Asp-Asp) domain-containing protein
VQRAVPFAVLDGGVPVSARAAAATVGEALRLIGVDLFPEDRLTPAPEASLSPGLLVTIWRARPVALAGKDLSLHVRSQAATVRELLAEQGVELASLDRVEPGLELPVEPYTTIRVVRVHQEEREDVQLLPYDTEYQPDPSLPAGWRQRAQAGVAGLLQRIVRVVYEDGEPAGEQVVASAVLREPRPELIRYGPAVGPAPLVGPGAPPAWQMAPATQASYPAVIGGYRVRQVLLMVATAYDPGPASTGKRPGDWGYGITASGMRAGYGVVATDPRVIPFYTRLYVPGYGFGIAGDTGGDIKGMRIDLGYNTYWEAINWGRRTVPVYVLE